MCRQFERGVIHYSSCSMQHNLSFLNEIKSTGSTLERSVDEENGIKDNHELLGARVFDYNCKGNDCPKRDNIGMEKTVSVIEYHVQSEVKRDRERGHKEMTCTIWRSSGHILEYKETCEEKCIMLWKMWCWIWSVNMFLAKSLVTSISNFSEMEALLNASLKMFDQ